MNRWFKWIDVPEMPHTLTPQHLGEEVCKLLEKYYVLRLEIDEGKPTRALVYDRELSEELNLRDGYSIETEILTIGSK